MIPKFLIFFLFLGTILFADSAQNVREEVRYQKTRAQEEFQRSAFDRQQFQHKQDFERDMQSFQDESLIDPSLESMERRTELREPSLLESR